MERKPNWITDSPEKNQANHTRKLLDRVKRERYSSGREYKTVKVCDHPPTYREVLVAKNIEKKYFAGCDPAEVGGDVSVKVLIKDGKIVSN